MLDSRASWIRLGLLLLVGSIGGVGMWSVVVTLPDVQAEFGAARAGAALPYTLTMLGIAAGGIVMGRAADRFGIAPAVGLAGLLLAAGYAWASRAGDLTSYALLHGVLVGLGAGALFGPVMAEASLWFQRRRGLAVSIAAAGNYVAGAVWPPIVAAMTRLYGWRTTELAIGAVMLLCLPALAWLLRAPPPPQFEGASAVTARPVPGVGAPRIGQGLMIGMLVVAALGCCVAMSMPQVHIVAYCADLGYGPARGAEMLSLMLGLGIVSRIGSGWLADRVGGLATLFLGSVLQLASLSLFLFFDSLTSLYLISGLFGLFQGGLVPSYAIIVREYFPARGISTKVGLLVAATIGGMALGGWMTGEIFDRTGSYRIAFLNGIGWNLLNGGIVALLLWQLRPERGAAVRGLRLQ